MGSPFYWLYVNIKLLSLWVAQFSDCYVQMKAKVKKLAKIAQRPRNQEAKKGEGDRRILTSKPRHLFSGKRKIGKTDRR